MVFFPFLHFVHKQDNLWYFLHFAMKSSSNISPSGEISAQKHLPKINTVLGKGSTSSSTLTGEQHVAGLKGQVWHQVSPHKSSLCLLSG